jgi:hypothetical protein
VRIITAILIAFLFAVALSALGQLFVWYPSIEVSERSGER